jgi:chemotaxis protein CheD
MDETVAVYYDREFERGAVKILPGQYHAARQDIVIVTVLGSCVSACLWDPAARIGGMNHFLLPGSSHAGGGGPDAARLGVYAMELLLNAMLKLGAARGRIVAKVFGGASVLEGMDALNVGSQNGAFVLEFLREERIALAAQDLYDVCPRKVYFFPHSGKVLVKRLSALRNDTLARRERDYLATLDRARAGEIEIFAAQARP